MDVKNVINSVKEQNQFQNNIWMGKAILSFWLLEHEKLKKMLHVSCLIFVLAESVQCQISRKFHNYIVEPTIPSQLSSRLLRQIPCIRYRKKKLACKWSQRTNTKSGVKESFLTHKANHSTHLQSNIQGIERLSAHTTIICHKIKVFNTWENLYKLPFCIMYEQLHPHKIVKFWVKIYGNISDLKPFLDDNCA